MIFPNYTILNHTEDTSSLAYPLYRYIKPIKSSSSLDPTCYPWESKVVDESDDADDPPDYQLYIGAGTVNGVINQNWDEPVAIQEDELTLVLLEVTLTNGTATAVDYSVVPSSSPPSGEDVQPVSENSLPNKVTIILGTVFNTEICMLYNYNIVLRSRVVYQKPVSGDAGTGPKYDTFYTVDPVAATTG